MVRRSSFSIIVAVVMLVATFAVVQPAKASTYYDHGSFEACYAYWGWTVQLGTMDLDYGDDVQLEVDIDTQFDELVIEMRRVLPSKKVVVSAVSYYNDRFSATYTNTTIPYLGEKIEVSMRVYVSKASSNQDGTWSISWDDDESSFQNDSPNASNCTGAGDSDSAAPWFNPNDGRVDPRPGDRLAVYCNAAVTPPEVLVYGVQDNSKGVFLAKFSNADLLKAGPEGMTKAVDGLGTVSTMQDGGNHFYVAWNGGQFKATGRGDFSKSFTCEFAQ
jgi:hypothetical protein